MGWKLCIWVGDRQPQCLCSQPECTSTSTSGSENTTWQISCFLDSFLSEKQFVSSKVCILKPQNSHVSSPRKASNLLLRWTSSKFKRKNLYKIFELCFIFHPTLIISLLLPSRSVQEPVSSGQGSVEWGQFQIHTVGINWARKPWNQEIIKHWKGQ